MLAIEVATDHGITDRPPKVGVLVKKLKNHVAALRGAKVNERAAYMLS